LSGLLVPNTKAEGYEANHSPTSSMKLRKHGATTLVSQMPSWCSD